MKKLIILVLVLAVMASWGLAQGECLPTLANMPCNVSQARIFHVNAGLDEACDDTDGLGCIRINGTVRVEIFGNNSIIRGSGNGIGLFAPVNAQFNVTNLTIIGYEKNFYYDRRTPDFTGTYDGLYNVSVVHGNLTMQGLNNKAKWNITESGWAIYQRSNCYLPYEDYTPTSTAEGNLCNGRYYLKDSDGDGTIILGGNNMILNGNNLQLIGNYTTTSYAVWIQGRENITIKNLNISNYRRGMLFLSSYNYSVLNNSFYNYTNVGIYLSYAASNPVANAIIENNSFYDSSNPLGAVYMDGVKNITIKNNVFEKLLDGNDYKYFITASSSEDYSNNVSIIDNTFLGAGAISIDSNIVSNLEIKRNKIRTVSTGSSQFAMRIYNLTNPIIHNNTLYNSTLKIVVILGSGANITYNTFYNNSHSTTREAITFLSIENSSNVFISNNTLNITDTSIVLLDSNNISIKSNSMHNALTNNDGWRSHIRIRTSSENISIVGNDIHDYGSFGILGSNSTSITIQDNDFKQQSISSKILNPYNKRTSIDYYEMTSAIAFLMIQKGYNADGDSTETSGDNISVLRKFVSSDITLSGNTFDANVQTYLRLQGTKNVTHDLASYWYRKFRVPEYLVLADEVYNNNLFDSLSLVPDVTTGEDNIFIQNWVGSNYGDYSKVNYSISKQTMSFKNVNQTTSYNLSLFNLSLAQGGFNQIFNSTSNSNS